MAHDYTSTLDSPTITFSLQIAFDYAVSSNGARVVQWTLLAIDPPGLSRCAKTDVACQFRMTAQPASASASPHCCNLQLRRYTKSKIGGRLDPYKLRILSGASVNSVYASGCPLIARKLGSLEINFLNLLKDALK